jgi:hypothetical protein
MPHYFPGDCACIRADYAACSAASRRARGAWQTANPGMIFAQNLARTIEIIEVLAVFPPGNRESSDAQGQMMSYMQYV